MCVEDRSARRRRLDSFIVCVPGLEPVLEAELAALGVRARLRHGGAAASLTTRQLYAANLHLRTATRVVVRIARFEARTFPALERKLRAVDWDPWIAPGVVSVARVTSHHSRLWHTGAVAERALDAVAASGRAGADRGTQPEQRVLMRLVRDQVTISIDSSGEPLHRRGWRGPTAKAPLRSTLAAAMLLRAGWHGQGPLVDPFCGSGTIPIEAALLARRIAPGLARVADGSGEQGFAFLRWPAFEPGTWASVVGAARASARAGAGVALLARDRDAGAIEATLDNARRAGVVADLAIEQGAISSLQAPASGAAPGWLVTNPPYGRRITGGRDRRDLFARLGQVVADRLPGWQVGVLVDDPAVARHSGLSLATAWLSTNGGLAVRYLLTG